MRIVLHLLSIVLVLPGVLFAGVLLVLERAIAANSWSGFFGQLMDVLVRMLPWGLLACSILLVLLVLGGFSDRFRWAAGSIIAALAIGSSVTVLVGTSAHSGFSLDQLAFFVPSVVSASIGAWLGITENPYRSTVQPAA